MKFFISFVIVAAAVILVGNYFLGNFLNLPIPAFLEGFNVANLINVENDHLDNDSSQSDPTIPQWQNDKLKVWQDKIGTYTLVIFTGELVASFLPENQQNLEEVMRLNNAELGINGGFYYSDRGRFWHSGLLMQSGNTLSPLNTLNTTQTTHVLFWNQNVFSVSDAQSARQYLTEWQQNRMSALQTGPLLINNNQLQSALIQSADNANQRSLRAVIGKLLSGERFIWIQKTPQTLNELAANLADHSILKGKIQFALNLDGGSSTSLNILENSKFNFFPTKQIPNFLLVK